MLNVSFKTRKWQRATTFNYKVHLWFCNSGVTMGDTVVHFIVPVTVLYTTHSFARSLQVHGVNLSNE